MRGTVTGGDPEGTWFRITLTREMPGPAGKSSELTDTYVSQFVERVPDTLVVERIEFESSDPALRRPMTMTTTLVDVDGATDVTVVHEGVPDEIPRADNEVGTRMALANLARFLNSG
jgi:hypothetical protein